VVGVKLTTDNEEYKQKTWVWGISVSIVTRLRTARQSNLISNTGRGKRLLYFTKCPDGLWFSPSLLWGMGVKWSGLEADHISCGKPPWASQLPFVYSTFHKLRMCQCYNTFYIRSFRLHLTCLSPFLSACPILRWTVAASVQRPTCFSQFKVIIKEYIQVDYSEQEVTWFYALHTIRYARPI